MPVAAITRFAPDATASLAKPATASAPLIAGNHPKMQIVPEGGTPFVVPYAPRDSQVSGISPAFDTIERPGRTPLLLRSGDQLVTMGFELVVAYRDWNQSIEPILAALRSLAASGARMRVQLDSTANAYLWRLTDFSQNTTLRQQGSNQPTRATCSMTFTQAADTVAATGPASGGASGAPAGSSNGKGGVSIPATYVVKKGDTLQSIATHFYGAASYWRDIADANKIKDPKTVKVGDKLKLPRLVIAGVLTAGVSIGGGGNKGGFVIGGVLGADL